MNRWKKILVVLAVVMTVVFLGSMPAEACGRCGLFGAGYAVGYAPACCPTTACYAPAATVAAYVPTTAYYAPACPTACPAVCPTTCPTACPTACPTGCASGCTSGCATATYYLW